MAAGNSLAHVRSPGEALLYLAMSAKDHQDAKALGPAWGDAYFLRGSVLNSLGRYTNARESLQQAVGLSPFNATYLIELAFSFEKLRDTPKALDLCETAEAMSELSPDDVKLVEKTRALRCEGFNLTDLHRYDEAVKQYEAALKLNPKDEISKRELEYIQQQRSKAVPSSANGTQTCSSGEAERIRGAPTASGVGYAVWYAALPSLKSTTAATVQLGAPILAAAGGVFFLGEPLTS